MNWSQCERVLMSVIVRTWVSAWSCMWSSWSIWHTRPCSTQTRLKDRREESSVHVSLQCKSWAHYNTNVERVYIERLTVSLNDAVAVVADVSEQLKHTCDAFGSWAGYLSSVCRHTLCFCLIPVISITPFTLSVWNLNILMFLQYPNNDLK